MGLLRSKIAELNAKDLALIGIPYDANSSFLRGHAKAPELIIEGVESASANYFTESLRDLDKHPRIKWCSNAELTDYLDIEHVVRNILEKGAIPISLGGDHSITYPILKAIHSVYGPVNILHFDAHTDLYDILDDNPFSHASPFARIMEKGLAKKIHQIGIRTLTQHTKEQADRFGVTIKTMQNFDPSEVIRLDGPTYLSFDIDVLDPAFAPGVSHHEPGGMTTREAIHVIQGLNLNIIGCDLVEYNPDRDQNGITAMVAAKILKELLDKFL